MTTSSLHTEFIWGCAADRRGRKRFPAAPLRQQQALQKASDSGSSGATADQKDACAEREPLLPGGKKSQEPATLGGSSAERCTTCCSRNANAGLGFTLEIFQKICKALIIFNISANFFFWCNHKFTIVAKRSGMNYKFQLAAKQTGIMCAVTIFSHNIPLQNWLKMRKEIVKLSLQRSI